MNEWIVSVPEDLTEKLVDSFCSGALYEVDGRELHLLEEETIGQFQGLKVEIFSNEHPPPHFRVKYQSSSANYKISDCSRMNGQGQVLKYERNIVKWWKDNKTELIDAWNRLRPTDCPVGLYKE